MATILNIVTSPLFGLVVGLILGALAVSGKFSLAAADALLVFAALVASFGIFNAKLADYRLTVAAIGGVAIFCLLVSYWIEPHPSAKAEATTQAATTSSKTEASTPATLRELFENGWPDLPAYYNVSVLGQQGAPSGLNITLPWRLNGDFDAGSKFLEFFFENSVSPQSVFNICVFISDHYREFITTAESEVDISARRPADSSATHLKDLVFSNRIFIYYENSDFSQQQRGSLEALYTQKGLTIRFRDATYAWVYRADHPLFRPEALTPNAILLPRATATGLQITATKLSP